MQPDHHCFYKAILHQLHYPSGYTIQMFRHQIGYYLAKHCEFFAQKAEYILKSLNMSYQAYILNVATGQIWGDAVILTAISIMFNVSITIYAPCYTHPWKIHHDSKKPQIVLIFNGEDWEGQRPVSLVSATGNTSIYNTISSRISELCIYFTTFKFTQLMYLCTKFGSQLLLQWKSMSTHATS